MTFINELINNVITIYSFMIYLGVLAVVIILQLKYIRIRSKKRIIFPIMVILISTFLYSVFPVKNSTENTAIMTLTVLENTTKIGDQYVLVDRDRNLIAIGQFVTNDDMKSQYIDVRLSNGVIHTSEISTTYANSINDAITNYSIKTSNKNKGSVRYGDLVSKREELNKKLDVDSKHFLFGLSIFSLPALSCVVLLIYDKFVRKRKNMIKKMKLKDIN